MCFGEVCGVVWYMCSVNLNCVVRCGVVKCGKVWLCPGEVWLCCGGVWYGVWCGEVWLCCGEVWWGKVWLCPGEVWCVV